MFNRVVAAWADGFEFGAALLAGVEGDVVDADVAACESGGAVDAGFAFGFLGFPVQGAAEVDVFEIERGVVVEIERGAAELQGVVVLVGVGAAVASGAGGVVFAKDLGELGINAEVGDAGHRRRLRNHIHPHQPEERGGG